MGLTKRQMAVFVAIGISHLCSGISIAVQAPFYPAVASDKGVSPTVYGLVFGIFQLTVFFISPICGQFLPMIGAKFMLVAGLFVLGGAVVLFGFLIYMNDTNTFIGFSFAIRITEALGKAGYLTASFSIATQEFSDCLATMISMLETFYGLGLAIGPTVGGGLYELGGFMAPFLFLGLILLVCDVIIIKLLPKVDLTTLKQTSTIFDLLKHPEIHLSMFAVLAASSNVGFIDVTLEPHLRQFGVRPSTVGLLYFLTGISYAVFAPICGRVTDRCFSHRCLVVTGAASIVLAFLLIGPAPFIPISPSIPLIAISLLIQGVGFAALMVASFTGAQKDAVTLGFPNDLATFSLVSGCWAAFYAFGAFFGPTCAGALLDAFEFRNASMFIVVLNSVLFILHILYLCIKRDKPKLKQYQLLENPDLQKYGTATKNFD